MNALQGKTALVTGGTSGIGRATARRFVAEGATVFVTGRRAAELEATVAELGPQAHGVRADVGVPAELAEVFAQIEAHGQGLDVVFANAGGGEFATLADTTPEHIDQTLSTNVHGTVLTVQGALPLLNRGASIVLTGSSAATSGTPAFGVYAATKAAIRSFARTWAVELADRGVRVNAVVPGPIDTEGLRGLAPDAEAAEALVAQLGAAVPLGRVGQPSEVAAAVVFLASDESSFVTGSELFVDGGEEQQ